MRFDLLIRILDAFETTDCSSADIVRIPYDANFSSAVTRRFPVRGICKLCCANQVLQA